MKQFFEHAISNITTHGDTDIFPFPIENHVFFDKTKDVVDLLLDIDQNFANRLAQFPPSNNSALAPISYEGFRWATQLDPVWNAFFLGVVLSIAEDIERVRIPKADNAVFSYRYQWDQSHSIYSIRITIGAPLWSDLFRSPKSTLLSCYATFQNSIRD
jgi:hypothetical protein